MLTPETKTPEIHYEAARPGYECPKCGEKRMDFLALDDEDHVVCGSCNHAYDLPPPSPPRTGDPARE